MDFKDDINQNCGSIGDNNSNDDSDIESRLYAEIYFANNIVGEENVHNPGTNSEASNDMNLGPCNAEDTDTIISYGKNTNELAQIQNDTVNDKLNNDDENSRKDLEDSNINLECTDAIDKMEDSNIKQDLSANESTQNIQSTNEPMNSNRTRRSNKRVLNDDCFSESIQLSNKKLKHLNNENLPNVRNKVIDLQKDESIVIDPCGSNKQSLVKVLSKKFYNSHLQRKLKLIEYKKLLMKYGVKNNKSMSKYISDNIVKKKNNKTVQRNKNNAANNIVRQNKNETVEKDVQQLEIIENRSDDNTLQNNEITINDVQQNKIGKTICDKMVQQNKDKPTENNVERCISSDISEIIDICSESSKDSTKDDSKYNTPVATDKKLGKTDYNLTDDNSESSGSDSEESIFEVPVPPKPIPPLIEVNDSDNENHTDNSSSESVIFKDSTTESVTEQPLQSSLNSANDVCNVDTDEDDEFDDCILSCYTTNKNRAMSTNEIRKLSKLSKAKESTKENNSIEQDVILDSSDNNRTDTNSVNQQNSRCNSANKERVSLTKKVTNASQNKQKNNFNLGGQNVSMEEYFFQPMTNEMQSFYNKSWGGENFDVDTLRSRMSRDPNKWAVLDNDLLADYSKSKRYFGMIVCALCQQPGHRQTQCSNPHKPPICHMCGGKGHFETSCKQKKCLTCGRKQNMYKKTCSSCRGMFCSRCNSQGHISNSCPDLWRRYHHTVNNDDIDTPTNKCHFMKPRNKLYCCNCAKKGHDSVDCNKYRWSQHFPNPPYVSNYNGPDYSSDALAKNTTSTFTNLMNSRITLDRSHNVDFTSDDLENLTTAFNEPFNFYNGSESNNIKNQKTLPIHDSINSERKIEHRIRSNNNFHPNMSLSGFTLKTNFFDDNTFHLENWKILFDFFDVASVDIPLDFLFKQGSAKIEITMTSLQRYGTILKRITNQFMLRNNFEKSLMYMKYNRDINTILTHFSSHLTEMRKLTECPLQLHKESQHLIAQLAFKQNSFENNDNSLLNRLYFCQQKMLMILHREGFGDNSLRILKRIFRTCKKNSRFCIDKRGQKIPNYIPIKSLCEYIYNFNNVFVPHQPKNLSLQLQKYKEFLEMRERIRNGPMFMRLEEKSVPISCDQPKEITSETSNVKIFDDKNLMPVSSTQTSSFLPTCSSMVSETSLPLPPTDYDQTMLRISSLKMLSNSINSFPANTKTAPKKSKKKLKLKAKKAVTANKKLLKQDNKSAMLDKTPNSIRKAKLKLKRLVKNTKSLISKACALNAPHLQSHILDLQKKMQNVMHLRKKHTRVLKKSVEQEEARQMLNLKKECK